MKIIIIGGVAGGMSAATRLRRLMEDAEIIVFEKGPFVSFANCGLPYFVSGEIDEREKLLVQTPEALAARFRLDVRPNHEVVNISPEEKQIEVVGNGQKEIVAYDVLILSPGAKPFVPNISGISAAENVFSIRNVPDIDRVMHALKAKPQNAVVVGAGFIGLEMAENLQKSGLQVTVVEQAPHVLPTLDEEMAVYVQQELVKQGVEVLTSQSVVGFEEKGKKLRLANGETLISDLTILSVGVQPESTLAENAGLKLGLRGGIVVNENYQTSNPAIYAVGDAIVVKQQITGEDALISLASPANRQGRQVADVIAGLPRTNQGSIGTAIVRTFDLAAGSTGLSEKSAKAAGLPVQVTHVLGKSHASYYPGATELLLKLIFNPMTGEIYGAQGVGAAGVDKRLDILATAIKGQLTIFELPELEFTYAPPFGSAKDPVNLLGYAAMNIAEGVSETIQWHELATELENGKILLDVRNENELANGKFKEAINIPLNDLRERLGELDQGKEYIVSCHSGLRSYLAERILKQAGFKVKNLDGAFALYKMVLPEEISYV
ncbi:FAD-dependent oxidoreductase [Candidatus Enterococcus courvalinii]|uniref:FAD-dependent oxidoreductase n=1 Tax=Candidatus Enterococcus courvalinii TaxID=2815329 RepID=A0ABS3I3A9_9ENTE|nr:FAD-dependent oxidoreductase [Enterococcus sp. MSG2901]MBO0482667.1 FAD-dependent oxidoreductase [Enterococcus sp. MSG2901]